MERRKQERIQYLCTRTWQVEGDASAHTESEVGFALQIAVLLCVRSVEPKIPLFRVGALSICLFHITKWACSFVNSWNNIYPILSSWRYQRPEVSNLGHLHGVVKEQLKMAECWKITQQQFCTWNVLRTRRVNVAFIHSISQFLYKPTEWFPVKFATTSVFNKSLNGIRTLFHNLGKLSLLWESVNVYLGKNLLNLKNSMYIFISNSAMLG